MSSSAEAEAVVVVLGAKVQSYHVRSLFIQCYPCSVDFYTMTFHNSLFNLNVTPLIFPRTKLIPRTTTVLRRKCPRRRNNAPHKDSQDFYMLINQKVLTTLGSHHTHTKKVGTINRTFLYDPVNKPDDF